MPWATWWFRGLALAWVIGAVATGYLWRVNTLKVRQRRLEALVARTKAIADAAVVGSAFMRVIENNQTAADLESKLRNLAAELKAGLRAPADARAGA